MNQAMYTGMNGLLNTQRNIDNISNNIANINTNGYKKSRTDFADALYARMTSPVDNTPGMNLQRGVGAATYQTLRVFSQGTAMQTGSPLDFMIEGDGFFTVEMPDGEQLYAKNGNMFLSEEGGVDYLVDANGHYVLDEDGARIVIGGELSALSVSADGTLVFLDEGGNPDPNYPAVRLGLVGFDNAPGLETAGSGYFRPTDNSGGPRATVSTVKQGALEASNVDYGEEVTRLIRAQRAYQMASRAVSTADQMAGIANTIRS